jgi:hypothetical protein
MSDTGRLPAATHRGTNRPSRQVPRVGQSRYSQRNDDWTLTADRSPAAATAIEHRVGEYTQQVEREGHIAHWWPRVEDLR